MGGGDRFIKYPDPVVDPFRSGPAQGTGERPDSVTNPTIRYHLRVEGPERGGYYLNEIPLQKILDEMMEQMTKKRSKRI